MNHTEKILIAYFALKGKETTGRDAEIADGITAKLASAGLKAAKFAITPVETYPDDAKEFEVITRREFEARVRPAITDKYSGMKNVKDIILVAPNWYNSVPQAVFTFFDQYDFSGKRVVPVIHHKGDGGDNITSELRKFLKNVDVFPAVDINDGVACDKQCATVMDKILSIVKE